MVNYINSLFSINHALKNGFKNILTKYKAANSNLSSRNECPKGLTKVPAEDFYKSINGLAYGTYAYVIKQFDKKDNLLLETEYIEFSLKAPKQPIMGRINRI